jgi:hypothetical protein
MNLTMTTSTHYRAFGLLLSVFLVHSSIAQNRMGEVGADYSPKEIKDKYYKWSEPVLDEQGGKRNAEVNTWFSKCSDPYDGYIVLKSGERLEGQVVTRWRYNQASTMTVKNDRDQDVPHPGGKSGTEEIHLIRDGVKKVYPNEQVKYYGPHFLKSEVNKDNGDDPAINFQVGEVRLKDGSTLEGEVKMAWWNSKWDEVRYYGRAYIAEDDVSFVQVLPSYEIARVTLEVDGKTLIYDDFDGWLMPVQSFWPKVQADYKDMGFDAPTDATVLFPGGKSVKGQLMLDKGRKKREAIFYHSDTEKIWYFSGYGGDVMSNIQTTIDGEAVRLAEFDGQLMPIKEIKEKADKKGELFAGKIMFDDGSEVAGEMIPNRTANALKSWRFIVGFNIFPSDQPAIIERYGLDDPIDHVVLNEKGKDVKYVRAGGIFTPYDELLKELKGIKSNDPKEELQPGYVMLVDGTKKTGSVSASRKSIYFVDPNDNIEKYSAYSDEMPYYVQTIDGVDRKFISMSKNSVAYQRIVKEFT